MRWLWMNIYSATADVTGCPNRMCRWCPFFSGLCGSTSLSDLHLTTFTEYAVYRHCPQSQVLTGRRKLEIFLGGRPSRFMLCLADILLSRPYVVWIYGRNATNVNLSFGFEVLTVGLKAHHIYLTP